MAGKGTVSVNHAPQHGDKTVIDKFRKATTTTPMSGAQKNLAASGRPRTGGGGRPSGNVDPAVMNTFNRLALAKQTLDFWTRVAHASDDPLSRYYLSHADKNYKAIARQTYRQAPNFE